MAYVCLALLGLVTLFPALGADFALIDDHEILSYSPYVMHSPELTPGADLPEHIFVQDPALGRARPLYWVIRLAEVALLGQNPATWHALYVALGVTCAGLMYGMLRSARVGWLPAALASAWVLVAPGVSSVWIRLGPQESLGSVCLLLAGLAAGRGARPASRGGRWDVMFAVALGLAPFVKESFTLAVPAAIGFRAFLLVQHTGRAGLLGRRAVLPCLPPLLSGTAMLLAAAVTAARSGAGSYGGHMLATSGLLPGEQDLRNLIVLAYVGAALTPVLVWCGLRSAVRDGRTAHAVRVWWAGAGLVLLLILPQLALYRANDGFGAGRYLLPAGLGLVAGLAGGVQWLSRNGYRRAAVITVTSWAVLLGFGGFSTWRAAETQRQATVGLSEIIDSVARSAPRGGQVAIVAEPQQQELAMSLPYHLAAHGRPDLDTRLVLVDAGLVADRTTCAEFSAVLVLANPEASEMRLPCLDDPALRARTYSPAAL